MLDASRATGTSRCRSMHSPHSHGWPDDGQRAAPLTGSDALAIQVTHCVDPTDRVDAMAAAPGTAHPDSCASDMMRPLRDVVPPAGSRTSRQDGTPMAVGSSWPDPTHDERVADALAGA